jgi:hypothetical protein
MTHVRLLQLCRDLKQILSNIINLIIYLDCVNAIFNSVIHNYDDITGVDNIVIWTQNFYGGLGVG